MIWPYDNTVYQHQIKAIRHQNMHHVNTVYLTRYHTGILTSRWHLLGKLTRRSTSHFRGNHFVRVICQYCSTHSAQSHGIRFSLSESIYSKICKCPPLSVQLLQLYYKCARTRFTMSSPLKRQRRIPPTRWTYCKNQDGCTNVFVTNQYSPRWNSRPHWNRWCCFGRGAARSRGSK